jgi:3-oxoacyl-[acyl-carrier protein] reductase
MRLAGQVAIVTGGGKGIGRVYVEGLAAEGAAVVAADVDEAAAEQVASALIAAGHQALGTGVDVADEPSVQRLVQRTLERFGHVDTLVNNAGLFTALPMHPAPWRDISVDEWDRVMAVNLKGVFLCSRHVIPCMQEQGGGSIINIASNVVMDGGRNRLHYVASKAGVVGLTRALARMVGEYNIRVNAIAPGGTNSDTVLAARAASGQDPQAADRMWATVRSLKRAEVPEDLVGTVVFLASKDSAFITGQTIVVDGGQNFV